MLTITLLARWTLSPMTRPFPQQQQPCTISSSTKHCTLLNLSYQPLYPVPQPGNVPYPTNQLAPYPTQPVTNPIAPNIPLSGQSAPYPRVNLLLILVNLLLILVNMLLSYPSQHAPYPSQHAPYPTQPVTNPTGPQTTN